MAEKLFPRTDGLLVKLLEGSEDVKSLVAYLLAAYGAREMVTRWIEEDAPMWRILTFGLSYHYSRRGTNAPNEVGHIIAACFLGALDAGYEEYKAADFAAHMWLYDVGSRGKDCFVKALEEDWVPGEIAEVTDAQRTALLKAWQKLHPENQASKDGIAEQGRYMARIVSSFGR